ncbi:SpvB/TcaC N-terminal domain-containing protein [Bradyrhizobium sp. USDA 336]|uniref:SpvB/TcaC N-terminal domain-containing protein n=1 Tax=Bradyrhizobium sp. USDA 336 TaxID=3156311 RepID=UPI00384C0C6C
MLIGLEPAGAFATKQAPAQPTSTSESAIGLGIRSQFAKIHPGEKAIALFGLSVARSSGAHVASVDAAIDVLVACEQKSSIDARILNLTVGCAAFRLLSNAPVRIGVPYDTSLLPDGFGESDVRLFKEAGAKLADAMTPIDAYLDRDNKTTVTTLSEQSGRFIAGVLRPGERPEKAPSAVSTDRLKAFRRADPLRGVPRLAQPQVNSSGDLRLNYPLDLPGVRETLQPRISIDYSAQSGSGNIANGWSLTVPTITVETRWGVPIYDVRHETETYLFNGEQMVPEAGDAFVDAQAGSAVVGEGIPSREHDALDRRAAGLNLVPQPHRTTHLRPRKTGKSHFVLRRDEGLWRFVRHGDGPSHYWWEAWQENPAGDVARVMYFGRAPGRIAGAIDDVDLRQDLMQGVVRAHLDLGPKVGLAAAGRAISKWGLTREKDAFGNIVDYDWVATCLIVNNQNCLPNTPGASIDMLADRDLYLKRVIYTGHQDLEETTLRCRERPSAEGCLRKQGLYELNVYWSSDAEIDQLPLRSDARSGGLIVPRRLVKRVEIRFRHRVPSRALYPAGTKDSRQPVPLHRTEWQCSTPFLSYAFSRKGDPLYNGAAQARQWLMSITKRAVIDVTDRLAAEDAIFPAGLGTQECKDANPLDESQVRASSHEMRFDYRDLRGKAFHKNVEAKFPTASTDHGTLIDSIRDIVKPIAGLGDNEGPFVASKMGAVETESFNSGIYVGAGPIALKGLSGGAKFTWSRRTSHRESTLLLDVNGDGILDSLILEDGAWYAYAGQINPSGHLSFGDRTSMALAPGFRFQHEPVMETTNFGGEGHIFGAIAGGLDGRSHAVQTVQLADMDGDGRADVVTPGGVFYNTTNSVAKYQFGGNTPFILNGTGDQAAATPILRPIEMPGPGSFPTSEKHPRYDLVRTWKAPFSGLVRVTGEAASVATHDDADEVWGVAGSTMNPERAPLADRLVPAPHRDGVIVAVERSRGQEVKSCAAGHLGPKVLDRLSPPEPAGPGSWSILGTRLVPSNFAGTTLDYRISVSGREALGAEIPTEWASSIRIRSFGPNAISRDALSAAIKAAISSWNAAHGKDANGLVVGNLSSAPMGDGDGVRLSFSGQMRSVPPLRLPITVVAGTGTERAGLELDTIVPVNVTKAKDQDGSPDDGHARVETRIVPPRFDPENTECAAGAADLDGVIGFLAASGLDQKLLVQVDKGDVLYFRVHAIDNGDDDAVNWAPRIQYLSAEEQVLQVGAGPVATRKIMGPGQSDSPDALILAHLRAVDPLCLEGERQAFCDPHGRSVLRYVLTDSSGGAAGDLAPMAQLNQGTLAPMTGAMEFSGTIEKPATIGAAYLEYVVVPIEILATRKATHLDGVAFTGSTDEERNAGANRIRACDADATRIGRSVTVAGAAAPFPLRGGVLNLEHLAQAGPGTRLTEMSSEAGSYRILKSGWINRDALKPACSTRESRRANAGTCASYGNEFDVRAGEKVCLFVRSRPLADTGEADGATLGYWPIDAAGFRILPDAPIALSYNTELAPLPKNAENPAPALANAECLGPLGDRPALGDNEKSEPTTDPNETDKQCQRGFRRLFAVPHIQHGPSSVLRLGHTSGSSPVRLAATRIDNPRRAAFRPRLVVPAGVPVPDQACTWGQSQNEAGQRLYERRFALEIRGIGPIPLGAIDQALLDDGQIDPSRLPSMLGDRVAKLRTRVLAWKDGKSRELPIKRFAVFEPLPANAPGGGNGLFKTRTRALSPGALIKTPDPVPATSVELLFDHRQPQPVVTQDIRFTRGVTGTKTFSSFREERADGAGNKQQRAHLLPSSHAGFAICAAEDEQIVVESAIDDGAANGLSPSYLNEPLDKLFGTNPCAPLPLDSNDQPFPSENPNSNEPFTRTDRHICPLGLARVLLGELNPQGSTMFTPEALAVDHRLGVSLADALRWRLPFEAVTSRLVAVPAIRHRADATTGATPWDIKDPVLPDSFPNFPKNPAEPPIDNADKLALLEAYSQLLGLVRNLPYERDYSNTDKARANGEQHARAPAFALVPEFRAPRESSSERAENVKPLAKSGADGPPAVAAPDAARFCHWPPAQTVAQTTNDAQSAADEVVRTANTNGPALEAKSTWARNDAKLVAAAGTFRGNPVLCMMGRDQAIWSAGDLLSASRLGEKDLHFGSKLVAYNASRNRSNLRILSTPNRGVGLVAPVRRSDTDMKHAFGGAFGFTGSESKSDTRSDQEVIDLNGDGFADVIVGGGVVASDARGGNRCAPESPWSITHACLNLIEMLRYPASPVKTSLNTTHGTSFGFPAAKKSAEIAVASARAAFNPSSGGTGSGDKGQRTQESYFTLNLNIDKSKADGERTTDVIDVNGDGLPDVVKCTNVTSGRKCDSFQVTLNLGNGFDSKSLTVANLNLFGEQSRNLGLGLALGWAYPLNDNSFEGGLAANAATGDQTRTLADVNGDGLVDILDIEENSEVRARLNTGWGFAHPVSLGEVDGMKLGTFGRSESDGAAAGGSYTYSGCIFIIAICFHVNPNVGLSGTLTRQSVVFRDADGDGLADFIIGESLLRDLADVKLKFSREKATVVANGLGQHGLLERVQCVHFAGRGEPRIQLFANAEDGQGPIQSLGDGEGNGTRRCARR